MSIEKVQKIDSTVKLLKLKLEDAFNKRKSDAVPETIQEPIDNSRSLLPRTTRSVKRSAPTDHDAELIAKKQLTTLRKGRELQVSSFNVTGVPRPPNPPKPVDDFNASTNLSPDPLETKTAVKIESNESLWFSQHKLKECYIALEPLKKTVVDQLCMSGSVAATEDIADEQGTSSESPAIEERSQDDLIKDSSVPVEAAKSPPTNPPADPAKIIRKYITHMMYTVSENFVIYQCKLCIFECSTKYDFQQHITRNHRNRWFGLCQSCVEHVHNQTGSLVDELEHMCKHIFEEKVTIKNLPPPGPLLLAPKKRYHMPMVSIPSALLHQQPESQPTKIKVKIMENYVIPASKPATDKLLDPAQTLNKIRPWLHASETKHQKQRDICDEMLKFDCLAAVFKCMGIGCSFYTSDDSLFRQHLALHLQYQESDFKNFSLCPYCVFSGDTLNELVDHILDVHGADKYQCNYCFYRSFDLQVGTHQSLYHSTKKSYIIICHPNRRKNFSTQITTAWSSLKKSVPGMSCMGEYFFYIFES